MIGEKLTPEAIQKVISSYSQDGVWREVCLIMESIPELKNGWRSLGYSEQGDIIDRLGNAMLG